MKRHGLSDDRETYFSKLASVRYWTVETPEETLEFRLENHDTIFDIAFKVDIVLANRKYKYL